MGAFGMVVSIAILSDTSSWQNVWERLWLGHSLRGDWGKSIERGLSSVVAISFALGIFTDWVARRYIGEDPEQKWDSYLARYASNLPGNAGRAGSFQPILSIWQRIFHPPPPDPIIFPSDADLKSREDLTTDAIQFTDMKQRLSKSKPDRKRSGVKFKPLGDYSDSDSDSDADLDKKTPLAAPQRPWLPKGFSSSPSLDGATLYGSDDELDKAVSKRVSEVENYSDLEGEDITSSQNAPLKRGKSHRDQPGWKPGFLSRPSDASELTAVSSTPPPPGAVPMTPSLIKAIDRIAVAQSEAYKVASPPLSPTISSQGPKTEWIGFWDRVQKKAAEAPSS